MRIEMTQQESIYFKLATRMLEIASYQFSNHICNDLDNDILEVAKGLNQEEFCEEFNKWNNNLEEDECVTNLDQIGDCSLMLFLAHKLKVLSSLENNKIVNNCLLIEWVQGQPIINGAKYANTKEKLLDYYNSLPRNNGTEYTICTIYDIENTDNK